MQKSGHEGPLQGLIISPKLGGSMVLSEKNQTKTQIIHSLGLRRQSFRRRSGNPAYIAAGKQQVDRWSFRLTRPGDWNPFCN